MSKLKLTNKTMLFPTQTTSCVSRTAFYQEMEKCFGKPIGSTPNAKVLSEERYTACFKYLVKIETNDLWRQRTIEAQTELVAAGYDLDELHRLNSPWKHLDTQQTSISNNLESYPAHIHPQLTYYLKCRRNAAAAALSVDFLPAASASTSQDPTSDSTPQDDPAAASSGVESTSATTASTSRQIKATISKGVAQRLFVELLPHPIGSSPQYRLIHSAHRSQSKTIVVGPSAWFDILTVAHQELDHPGRDKLTDYIRLKYWNVPKLALEKFTLFCSHRQGQLVRVPGQIQDKVKNEDMLYETGYQQEEQQEQQENRDSLLYKMLNTPNKFLSRLQIFIISRNLQGCPFEGMLCFHDLMSKLVHISPVESFSAESIAFLVLGYMQMFGGIHILHFIGNFDDLYAVEVITHVNKHWNYPVVLGESKYDMDYIGGLIQRIETSLQNFVHDMENVPVGVSAAERWKLVFGNIAYCINCETNQNGKSSFEEAFGREPNVTSLYPCLSNGQVAKLFGKSVIRETDLVQYLDENFSLNETS